MAKYNMISTMRTMTIPAEFMKMAPVQDMSSMEGEQATIETARTDEVKAIEFLYEIREKMENPDEIASIDLAVKALEQYSHRCHNCLWQKDCKKMLRMGKSGFCSDWDQNF